MNKYLSEIGYQGYYSLLILILLVLAYNQVTNPLIYAAVIAWQLFNHLVNITVKNIIKAESPDSQPEEFAKIKKSVSFQNYFTVHRNFGMPSGHAQAVVSSFVFILLYFNKPILTGIAAVQTGLTLWQRYETRRHSIAQLVAGSALGIIIGIAFYTLVLKYNKCNKYK